LAAHVAVIWNNLGRVRNPIKRAMVGKGRLRVSAPDSGTATDTGRGVHGNVRRGCQHQPSNNLQ